MNKYKKLWYQFKGTLLDDSREDTLDDGVIGIGKFNTDKVLKYMEALEIEGTLKMEEKNERDDDEC